MKQVIICAALATIWSLLMGEVSVLSFSVSYMCSHLLVSLLFRTPTRAQLLAKIPYAFYLLGYYIYKVIEANLQVARSVLSPLDKIRPGIVAIPLDVQTDAQITLLAHMITMTPGTLTLDVSTDRSTLFVHAMDASDPNALRQDIKQSFEKKILHLFN